ncbi:DUF2971 domain-containing protein [Salmonella enterica subsp. enterica]|uniref:DUF2971 domain-containing protein n=2 Tax=Enterobacteriaceae TaxID=543 RepID=UPI0030B5AC90
MLVKYIGESYMDKPWPGMHIRTSCLEDGFFRATQPKYLNDPSSESRLLPFFNKFSPADYAWARNEFKKMQRDPSYVPSIQELEYYLKPCGKRYGEDFPHLLINEGFTSMDSYDESKLQEIVTYLNDYLVEAVSCHLGVFSLSKSDCNLHMWTHYASIGKGVAVVFDETHDFFKIYRPCDVSYNPEDRASVTYYKGAVRFNGYPAPSRNIDIKNKDNTLHGILNRDSVRELFINRLLYTKGEEWLPENESRIIFPLADCERKIGSIVSPSIDDCLLNEYPDVFHDYHEINLKKIPFSAFKQITLGYNMTEKDKNIILDKVSSNKELSHLNVLQSKLDIYGKVVVNPM